MDLEHAHVPTGDGVYLHCVLAGPVDAAPLVAVHGGPDWDHSYLLDPLIRLGHRRLILPDLRGCGRSSPGPAASPRPHATWPVSFVTYAWSAPTCWASRPGARWCSAWCWITPARSGA